MIHDWVSESERIWIASDPHHLPDPDPVPVPDRHPGHTDPDPADPDR
jgi:hypothetical protein